MRIASHLIEGSPDCALHDALGLYAAYTPVCAWPDDCLVQWGNGISPPNPFFEAFPPGTFIRGDGATIEEAERKAFAQFESEHGCAHQWSRQSKRRGLYLNGAGWCRRCDAFRSQMFAEVVILGHRRQPLSKSEQWLLTSYEEDDAMSERMDRLYPHLSDERRTNARLLRIRLNLFGAVT